jgi:hypothetical protein
MLENLHSLIPGASCSTGSCSASQLTLPHGSVSQQPQAPRQLDVEVCRAGRSSATSTLMDTRAAHAERRTATACHNNSNLNPQLSASTGQRHLSRALGHTRQWARVVENRTGVCFAPASSPSRGFCWRRLCFSRATPGRDRYHRDTMTPTTACFAFQFARRHGGNS